MTVTERDEWYSNWLKERIKKDPTPDQLRCVRLMDLWLGGLHHAPKVRECGFGIELLFQRGKSFSTFDFDELTKLVLLAHDLCVRA